MPAHEPGIDQLRTTARILLEEVTDQGPLDRFQLVTRLLVGTDEDLAVIESGMRELLEQGLCERRPDPGLRDLVERDQPIGLKRPW